MTDARRKVIAARLVELRLLMAKLDQQCQEEAVRDRRRWSLQRRRDKLQQQITYLQDQFESLG